MAVGLGRPVGAAAGRGVGLTLQEAVPDAKTIWLYRKQLTSSGALAKVFARFDWCWPSAASSLRAGRSSMPLWWRPGARG